VTAGGNPESGEPAAGFRETDSANVEAITQGLERKGWRVFRLPAGIRDKAQFFDAVRSTLPLDPPLSSTRMVWDALSDSLWSGLDDLPQMPLVIHWPEAWTMRETDPDNFGIATEVLRDLPASLSSEKYTVGKPRSVLILQATTP
jgi:Barstar (barnase inhibitor)